MATSQPQLISILAPPGSGKGTQCALLTQHFHITHYSVGGILREEAKNTSSPWADIIKSNMSSGKIGPKEMTAQMLQTRIDQSVKNGVFTFLLDGFPRRIDQAEYFESVVAPLTCVVRLSRRGRADDTPETIKLRIKTFEETTREVVEKFGAMGTVVRVRSDGDVGEISKRLREGLEERGVMLEPKGEKDLGLDINGYETV
ncbi:P-loop containing nucleoside triphosphate hydrolase protein [Setomelanomma holmii]|uniref:P-loop containing nucleoside triphosphate hydrolase protein n=1 Tax=Setomelanomma holmii TaxID=210430 RepID=A0A9P4HI42_9PLEO|nr:P-loop containing nucleoside triphosphate hydrolase protein [Setomelanomma holmii]